MKTYSCDQENCSYSTQSHGNLKKHKATKHLIIHTLYYCREKECNFICKDKSSLNRHKAFKHNPKEYECDICQIKIKADLSNLKRHQKQIHSDNFKEYFCNLCDFKTKNTSNLKQHKSNIHDIGIEWYICLQENCEYKSKKNGDLNRHLKNTHEINVRWFVCQEELCNYKCKSNSHLLRHMECIHDIGEFRCDYCFQNRNSHISHKKHTICRNCFNKDTGKNSRIEEIWSDYIDKHLGVEYLLSSDKSLKSQGGCSLRRPDKLYIGIHGVEIDECDEYQHKYNNGDYHCEEDRLMEIYDEPGIMGKHMIVIRWNPHSYKQKPNKSQTDRLKQFIDLKMKLRKNPPKDKIHVYYMFYDQDSHRIVKNIPYTMVN